MELKMDKFKFIKTNWMTNLEKLLKILTEQIL